MKKGRGELSQRYPKGATGESANRASAWGWHQPADSTTQEKTGGCFSDQNGRIL